MRGRRECRVRAAPAVSCAKGEWVRARAYRLSGGIRHPLRNGFTAYAVLSPATNSSCHRHRRIDDMSAPGWVDIVSADLTPATGARTTRFCRTQTPTQKVSTGLVPVRRSFSEGGFSAVRLVRRLFAHRSKSALRLQS